jgi:2-keto-4-pentenoate hydratase
MSHEHLAGLARDLADAWDRAVAIPAPTTHVADLTEEDAYAIQELVIAGRLATGRHRAGWKMGLTSAPPPAVPIVGTVLDDMIVPSGSELDLSTMVDPMVEAEVVVRIGETVDRAQSVAELINGPHEIGPGLEVIDYRTTDSSGPIDWIADNSTVAYAVLGTLVPIGSIDPVGIQTVLSSGDTDLGTGRGDQVMGNPIAAVAWLSHHLVERGHRLEAGDVILTGSLTGHHAVAAPDRLEFLADFAGLDQVRISFRN